tara:strand:+ start:1532 stop:3856 length:2325 start_codon:yes stop_codon:yes gene_type:complete
MKILHVTDELSKKNYSISSLILFLANFFQSTQGFSFNILASEIQTDLFEKDKDIKIISFFKISDLFNRDRSLKEVINSANVIHIHGLWRAINLLVVFYCIQEKKNFFIHPHGMLLEPSLKHKGLINYYFKKVGLIIFNIAYGKNLNFISITNKEVESILNFFPSANNIYIPNPVTEFQKIDSNQKLERKFVFFGRLHSIKNIDLMITAFVKSNVDENWSLEIYGIPDDKLYEKSLRDKIENIKNVHIKKPVFGKKKNEILKTSWANLLLSKSEVLSLSVLESANLGLPSLVNKNIQIDKYAEHEGEVTSLRIEEISNKIFEISNWTKKSRIEKGKKLQKFINENFHIEKIKEKYLPVYSNLEANQNPKENNNILNYFFKFFFDSNFMNISISYLFNFMIPTFIMLLVTFAYNKSLGADIAITSSVFITLTQIFSSNMKAQILATSSLALSNHTILFRILFSLFIISLSSVLYFSQSFYIIESSISVILIVCIILIQWICEIILCIKEIKKENFIFIFYNFVNFIFIILFFFAIVFYSENLNYILISYIFFITLFTVYQIFKEKIAINVNLVIKGFKLNIKSFAFLSSTSLIVSSIIWRLIIFNLFPKSISAIIFACFSIGSFPGTAFNLAIGPSFIRQNISISNLIKKYLFSFYIIIFFLCFISAYYLYLNKSNLLPNNYFIFYTLSFSLMGSFFMTYAMYVRQKSIQFTNELRSNIFIYDIAYGLSISFYCPLLYYIGDVYGTSLSFFFASITAFIIYSVISKKIRYSNVSSN